MKLLIAALALLSFVATSALPDTVMAQAATGQTQTAPDQTNMGTPAKKTTRKHTKSKKKSSTKKHTKSKKKPAKKHRKKTSKTKKPPTSTNPS
jgi:hypothetical protein